MKTTFILTFLLTIFHNAIGQFKSPVDDGRKISIPVLFHVLYANDKEKISDSLILNELRDLNLDFAASNDMTMLENDFRNIVGNPSMEFYLLDTLLQDSGIKGVKRIPKSNINNINSLLVNPTLCLNVFIAAQGNASDILGDRVNLNYEDVGTHSHVLTHESGHWLGLYHIWGKIGSCNKIKLLFSDHNDDIEDTPLQGTCTDLSYSTICPPPKKLTYKGHKVLYNNFMDYNGCRCMFTAGQSTKMRNNIIVYKQILFNRKS